MTREELVAEMWRLVSEACEYGRQAEHDPEVQGVLSELLCSIVQELDSLVDEWDNGGGGDGHDEVGEEAATSVR